MLNKYSWAILGCGNIANDFARDITRMGGKIYSVANRTYEKAVEFAEKYNINKVDEKKQRGTYFARQTQLCERRQ